jgi:glucoside 3-dehydrogenase (cytochrome c) hitch-hiker subunit
MQRREVLRLLTSAAALSAMPSEWVLSLQQARADMAFFPGLRTLNPHQNGTVTLMAELIIPATDTPGATGAKVNEFMDMLLTDWFDAPDKNSFLEGLAHVDAQSKKHGGKDFVSCTSAQQLQLMKQFDDEAMVFARSQKEAEYIPTPLSKGNFFYTFKKLTLVGYYTSEIGFKKELGKSIIPPGHAGCAPLTEAHR